MAFYLAHSKTALFALASALVLSACSGNSKRPAPADLGANTALIGVKQAWANRVGAPPVGAWPAVVGSTVVVAAADGTVAALDAATGRDLWRGNAGVALSTGAGSDGKLAAVVTTANEVVAMDSGKEIWRTKIGAQTYTAPLVAGGRIFVLAADRSVSAFDGTTGRQLWTQKRTSDPLVLKQPGSLLAVGDTLVAGMSGRLVGLNPNTGVVRWEAALAAPRGANEIERLVDMTGRANRVGNVVCVRAYQSAVGCVDAVRGNLVWTKPANGSEGVHGDDQLVIGTEGDGKVVAWRRNDGERIWTSERLRYRDLSAPLVLGRSVVIGDSAGTVHLLSRQDGSPLNRLTTDSSGVVASPVQAGDTLIVVTRNGGIYGFAPE
jgi:outer membrane protein assembly factor BamB